MNEPQNIERDESIRALRKQGFTLQVIGNHFGLTKERIRQLTKGIPRPLMTEEEKKASAKRWRDANKEHVGRMAREWREANLERATSTQKRWNNANREKVNATARKWYAVPANKAKHAVRMKRYYNETHKIVNAE